MNPVVHFEVTADDLNRARKFYETVFGWQLMDMPGMAYAMASTGPVDKDGRPTESGYINGGITTREVPGEQSIIVMSVADLDAHVKKVEDAGGKIVTPKVQIGDMGLYAKARDTEGNVIGLWEDLK